MQQRYDFFYSDEQYKNNTSYKDVTKKFAKLDSGRVVKYTECKYESAGWGELRPHIERFADSISLGSGVIDHTKSIDN